MTFKEKVAKAIVKNKFWVVEDHGEKIATIQAKEDGGFVYVHDNEREYFPSIKVLSKQYNIIFDKATKIIKAKTVNEIYGFPTSGKAHNELYDVSRKLPVYTKSSKSRSFHCAGYYIVKLDKSWTQAYCPKLITLNRYEFRGPFRTKEEMIEHLRVANGQ